jgi:ABC-type antimicrobial peptide transport system permease subunit
MFALGYFTFKDLIHDRWRSILTILGIAVIVVAYLLLSSISQAFLVFNKQAQVTSNLVIIAADVLDPMESSLEEEILQTAWQIAPDQIQRIFPIIFRHLNIDGKIMQIRAVPLEEMTTGLALTLFLGRLPDGEREIVVSEGVAQIASWKMGSTVNIYGSDFVVTGLVRSGENNTGAVWMTYGEGQNLFGMRRGFQAGYLVLKPATDPESVRTLLQADSRISACCSVYLENALSTLYYQVNHNLLTLNNIMALVSLLAITFGIYNATNLSLTERSHEIGLLRVLGFAQDRLRGILLARTLVLTLAAYSLGWVISVIFIDYHRTHTTMGVSAAPLILQLTPAVSLLGLALAIAFSFLGVMLTSGRLAGLSPLAGSD